ncbi:hypothetical protein NW762_010626 [Fusarium torreyae]|uniref:Uncharacterized protein n=1 Tax=Fusarium torreyae TaxID=1237075 RepID=A0A9W8VAS7_9HYPO|nr:hypothetical protein NW762_010626 [Fusarium torreyae]
MSRYVPTAVLTILQVASLAQTNPLHPATKDVFVSPENHTVDTHSSGDIAIADQDKVVNLKVHGLEKHAT